MRLRLALVPCAVVAALVPIGSLASAHHASSREPAARPREPAASVPQGTSFSPNTASAPRASTEGADVEPSAFARLAPVRFSNENTRRTETIALYDSSGHVNEAEAARLDALLCDTRDANAWATLTLDRRTLQLAVRTALHFHVALVQVISAYRKPGRRREGPHASGKAIDFKLPGVAARTLAAYLRGLPRVGVGVYTHPKTSYVHLDDREHSFHWLDASPPGRSWRELSIGNASLPQRDAAYRRADDWPEGTTPPDDSAK